MTKHFFVCSFMSLLSLSVLAQVKPKVATAPKPSVVNVSKSKVVSVPQPPANILKSSLDTFYYSLGANIAFNLKDQGIDKVNNEIMSKGMNDVFQNKPLVVTEQQANTSIQKKLQESAGKKLSFEKEKGKAFLDANAKRKGVISLPNGLQYEVVKKGDSTSVMPKLPDTVLAHYAGALINGTEFDNSYKRGKPLSIAVGGVIRGWTEILQLMHIGDKWRVYIPSELGYGDRGSGAIPGGSTLIFDMELLGVTPAAVAPEKPVIVTTPPTKDDPKKEEK
jgi:FKBP-type peptidyl-prolyl cis-trans isomerase FklB